MTSHIFPARRRSALGAAGAIALSAALLAACGGGSSDGGDSASNGAAAPVAADFLGVANKGAHGGWGTEREMVVFDREHPEAPPRLSVSLTAGQNFVLSEDGRFDTATRTAHIDSPSVAYYVLDHKLYQVSLRKADATVPQQISSLTAVCSIRSAGRHTSAGGPDWVEVVEGGPDGDCTDSIDTRIAFVRSGAPTTAAATFLPTGVRLLADTLDHADNALTTMFFLAEDTRGSLPKLVLYHPDLTPAGDVAGGELSGRFRLLEFSSTNDTGFEAIGTDDLGPRRISWSTAGASLSARLYTFQESEIWMGSANMTTDSDNLYLSDGLEIKRLAKRGAGAWETVGRADAALGNEVTLVGVTPTRLVISQSPSGLPITLWSIPKSGGAQTPLATLQWWAVYDMAGEQLTYAGGDRGTTFDLMRVRSDGTDRSTVGSGLASVPMRLFRRKLSMGQFTPDALLWCDAAPGNPYSSHCNLKSFNMYSGLTTVLGSPSLPASMPPSNADLYTDSTLVPDSPVVLSASHRPMGSMTEVTDVYVLRPDVAGSLSRVAAGP